MSSAISVATNSRRRFWIWRRGVSGRAGSRVVGAREAVGESGSVIRSFRRGVGRCRGRDRVGFHVQRTQQRVNVGIALAIFYRVVEQRLGEVQTRLVLQSLGLKPAQRASRKAVI